MRAPASDLRDLLFEQRIRRISRSGPGLVIAMFRRAGAERGIMTYFESMAEEFADLFTGGLEHVDLDQDRPRLVVIEGTPDAVNDDVPPSPEAA